MKKIKMDENHVDKMEDVVDDIEKEVKENESCEVITEVCEKDQVIAEKVVEETDDDECGFIESKEFVNKKSIKEETKEIAQNENAAKRKIKEEKPPTKVIIRNLPPTMTENEFSEAISPIPAYDFFYYVKAEQTTDRSLQSYSRAYINFIDPDNVHFFYDTFDNYVFVDSKGYEYPAQVELAPYQKIQRKNRRRDKLIGLIETDQSYITFKEMYELESSEPLANKQHFLETEIATVEEITTTPLIEFMKQKRAEKARLKDEKREERKRKESERRQKQQKFREKREDEEATKDIKVLASPRDRKDSKEGLPKAKKYEEKDKKEIRTREFKNKNYDKNERKKFSEKKGDENDEKEDTIKHRRGQNRHENDENQEKEKYSRKDDNYKRNDERRPHRYKDDRPSKPTARSQKFLNSKKSDFETKDDSKVDKKLDNKERDEGKEKNEEKDKRRDSKEAIKKDEKEVHKESKNENSSNKKEETKPDRKDPRTNRRIRNKDRPSIEIYRPGMGKFSKQKKQGSTEESPSHSPPPSNDAKSSSD